MDGNTAAAWAVRLGDVKVVPNFPVTPQTELIETLAKWKANGEWKGEFVDVDQVEPQAVAAKMQMGVDQARDGRTSAQVDGLSPCAARCTQGIVVAHGDNAVPGNRDRLRGGCPGIHRMNDAVV